MKPENHKLLGLIDDTHGVERLDAVVKVYEGSTEGCVARASERVEIPNGAHRPGQAQGDSDMYRVLTDRACECAVCGEIGSAPNEVWYWIEDDVTVCEDCADESQSLRVQGSDSNER